VPRVWDSQLSLLKTWSADFYASLRLREILRCNEADLASALRPKLDWLLQSMGARARCRTERCVGWHFACRT